MKENEDALGEFLVSDDNLFSGTLRLRRCKSTSRAEDIVTETEKVRRAQPDKPIHRPRDSLLSLTSGFQNFEGILNWAILILSMGGLRLFLENLNKYGIRVDPNLWLVAVIGNISEDKPREYPFLLLLGYIFLSIYVTFLIEMSMSKGWISRVIGYSLHFVNLIFIIIIPIVVISSKYKFIGPVKGTLIIIAISITFLKIWSYVQVNYWCVCEQIKFSSNRNGIKNHLARNPSLMDYSSVKSRHRLSALKLKLIENQESTDGNCVNIVKYPDNLTLKDIAYFIFAPTLCYELNFPRMERIRKMFLLRRLMEVVVGVNVTLALIQQWVIPSVVNSLIPFSNMEIGSALERLLKLAIPNHLIWLIWFYLIFHSLLNTIGEIMGFADRQFYRDWWNAINIQKFWTRWNVPVHRWCYRHMYRPLLANGISVSTAKTIVFIFSAFFHEFLISIPLGVVKPYAFLGMIFQVPLLSFSKIIEEHYGPRFGNVIVWMSLILGQPLAVLMYYHDFVIEHYGTDLIDTFGHL